MSDTIGTTLDASAAAPTSELALRIRGGDYHGRIVRIRASQCTVGSAPDCTLRLSGPGLRPLHCIILRNDAGVTVRRWSPDTQLNGRAFSDALLMPGDRLGIGPIELEVLDDADLSLNRRPEVGTAAVPVAELAQEVVSQLRRDLRRDKSAHQSKIEKRRLRQSRRRIKSLEAELERLQASVNSIAAIDHSPVVHDRPDAARFEAERGAWEIERHSLQSKLQEKESAAQRLERTLDELHKTIEQEHVTEAQEAGRQLQAHVAEIGQLRARCDELVCRSEALQQAEAAATGKVKELQDRIAALEQVRQSCQPAETSDALQSTQRQLHETFAECERLREEIHQANCALAAAQCRLTEQEAALAAFREMHQHAVAELDLECKTLQAQLADTQTKFDEQTGRLAELESQAHAAPMQEHNARIAELESQLQARDEQLSAVRTATAELQSAGEQSSAEWARREQELMQRADCLERLAANLEDELRKATSSPDRVQVAEEQRQTLEQQLAAAQRQWTEQRQLLEDQALSAHQQVQDMENQVASMRDALHTAQGQVRERDQLLSQLRDEVRQQLDLWQQERAQLHAQLQAANQGREPAESQAWPAESAAAPEHSYIVVSEPAESSPNQDRYTDRQMTAGGHALAEIDEASPDSQCGSDSPQPEGVGNVQASLEVTSILPHKDDQVADQPPSFDPSAAIEHPAEASWPDAAPQAGEQCTSDSNATCFETSSDVTRSDDENTFSTGWSSQATATNNCGDDEESIEAYMARLLKRVRGDAVANAFVGHPTALEATVAATPMEAAQSHEPSQPATLEQPEFLPRKPVTEQTLDVAAMRELAVQSTRQAINRSVQLRFQRKSLATTLGACALMGLSAGLFGWGFDTGNWLAWSGSGVCLLGAVYLMTRRMNLRRMGKSS